MASLMQGGDLMKASADPKDITTATVPIYERVMFQQLAQYTWTDLEVDNVQQTPFIAFGTRPCDIIDPSDNRHPSNTPGPNPWKVIIILEELHIPYKITSIRFEDIKKPPFIEINPNGRAPAIIDPNTDLTLWESGAIIQYLIEQYDTQKKLTYESVQDRQHLNQWLMFQMSGQGPYYGQCGWFNVLHPEKLPSAQERYNNEVKRILSVLENHLAEKQWLVGDKCTFADLSFVTWNDRMDMVLGVPDSKPLKDFPNVEAWHDRMISRDSFKNAMRTREKLMDEQGLMPNGMPKGINNMAEYEAKMKSEGDA